MQKCPSFSVLKVTERSLLFNVGTVEKSESLFLLVCYEHCRVLSDHRKEIVFVQSLELYFINT